MCKHHLIRLVLPIRTEAYGRRGCEAPRFVRRSWRLARKLLNIYIRDCVYSRLLCAHYRLEAIEPFLEVPLDSFVAKGLTAEAMERGQTRRLPKWSTIKGLERAESDLYQAFASELAAERGHARIHLDVVLWGARD